MLLTHGRGRKGAWSQQGLADQLRPFRLRGSFACYVILYLHKLAVTDQTSSTVPGHLQNGGLYALVVAKWFR